MSAVTCHFERRACRHSTLFMAEYKRYGHESSELHIVQKGPQQLSLCIVQCCLLPLGPTAPRKPRCTQCYIATAVPFTSASLMSFWFLSGRAGHDSFTSRSCAASRTAAPSTSTVATVAPHSAFASSLLTPHVLTPNSRQRRSPRCQQATPPVC